MLRQLLKFRYVSYLLAALLAVTAALKLHLLLTDPFADIKAGTSLAFLWLAVLVELASVWMVFSAAPDLLRWVTLTALFGTFTAVSAYNVISGKAHCACAGTFKIEPVWFLMLNVSCVLWLVSVNRIETKTWWPEWNSITSASFGRLFGIGIGVAMLFTIPTWKPVLEARFFAKDIEIAPVKLGEYPMGDSVEFKIVLRNHSTETRKIVGITKSCNCIFLDEVVGAVIPRQGQLEVRVSATAVKAGDFHQRLLFFLDSTRQPSVAGDLFCFFLEN